MPTNRRAVLVFSLILLLPGFPSAAEYKIEVRGADEASFTPRDPKGYPKDDGKIYDAVVVGGGLAGLSAAVFLSDQGKTVLLLEKEDKLGGLAFGGEKRGLRSKRLLRWNRGAAYWTAAYEEELKILERIGMADYAQRHAIPEPIDSYLWKGTLYEHLWDDKNLGRLPASFALFKSELLHANTEQLIPNQPLEEAPNKILDTYSASDWIRSMPQAASKRTDEASRRVWQRFITDPAVGRLDPMEPVVDFMDLFCPSALGATTRKISAIAFANFYISEIETRFTTPIGTGEAVEHIEGLLKSRPKLVKILTRATVRSVSNTPVGAGVVYLHGGKLKRVRGRAAVWAAQLKFAPQLIAGFAAGSPEQAALMGGLEYANFSVHAAFVKGHPYRASFDTWTRAFDHKEGDFTDVILGRWVELKGYEGLRDFKSAPPDEDGVMTVYHPHPLDFVGKGYTAEQSRELARGAVERMVAIYDPVLHHHWGTKIEVKRVETNRWPYSIHIVAPGHFTRKARILRKPFGRVVFANNNVGTPTFEEALFRGHCAANNALKALDPAFRQEPWSRCPLDN